MEDRELEIANLQVRISMLQREEQHWMAFLADASRSADHNEARQELHKVITQILSDVAAIRKLGSKR